MTDTISKKVTELMGQQGAEYTAGFLTSQLEAAIGMLPKTKQKMALAGFHAVVDSMLMVTVKSLMTKQDVQIRKCDRGGPCDPSTERYWSM